MDVNEPHMVGVGTLWPVNPITDEILGQIELAPSGSPDSTFYAMISDFAGAPKELVDVTTGGIVGYSKQSLFGKRAWFGERTSPLLFAGQYEDAESGWVYNRFRYYNTMFGMYNAQDPLGVGPNLASAQAYVDNPTTWVDVLGLASHPKDSAADKISRKIEEIKGRPDTRPGHKTHSKLQQYEAPGGYERAKDDFYDMIKDTDAVVTSPKEGMHLATFPGRKGMSVNVRKFSSDSRPTLQAVLSKNKYYKIRYDD